MSDETTLATNPETALATTNPETPDYVQGLSRGEFVRRHLPAEFLQRYARTELESEIEHCFEVMRQTGLNPYLKQIYFIPRKDKRLGREVLVPQTSIDGYRLIAERTGLRDGEEPPQWCGTDGKWREVWNDKGPPVAARFGVYRKGSSKPFWGVAHYREFNANTHFWSAMPANQLAKVAEAMALRRAFPQETANLYTEAEMDQAEREDRSDHRERADAPEEPATAEEFDRFTAKFQEIASTRFENFERALSWLRDKEPSLESAPARRLRRLLGLATQLKPRRQVEQPDQAETPAEEPANQDAEARRRKAAQRAWGIAAGKCGLSEAEVYWYMGEAFGWVHDPGKGRPSANATPIPQIEAAIHALNSLSPEEVDKVRQDYAFWLDDQNRPEADQ